MEQSLLTWGVILISVFPILIIGLGEGIERLARRDDRLANVLRNARNYVLPSLAILLVMQQLLKLPDSALQSQIVQTIFWIASAYTFVSLLNETLTTEANKKVWQIRVPNLLFQVARIVVILSAAAYILASIWKIDLNQVASALGIGSLVIALALQDTLSNLVSGFLLLIESPFKVGDWLRINDIEAQVLEMNWRAVRLKTRDRDVVIIPNGVLGQDTIYNYTLLDPLHADRISVRFSFDDPPNRVKQVVQRAALSTEGILSAPEPEVLTKSFSDFSIDYEVVFYVKDFEKTEFIRNEFLTRIYYTAKRYNLTIPYPIGLEGDIDYLARDRGDRTEEILEYLRSLPYFRFLNREIIEKLAKRSTVKSYGTGERVIRAGEFDTGFYIIQEGSVTLLVKDIEGRQQEVARLSGGDFFGETVLLSGEPSLVSVTVTDDLSAILIEPEAVTELVQQNPRFAREINQFIEERIKAVRLARGIEDATEENAASNGQVKGYQLLRQLMLLSDT
jgi:small-conductance mechanosensitive channel